MRCVFCGKLCRLLGIGGHYSNSSGHKELIILHYVAGGELIEGTNVMKQSAVRWANGEYKDLDMRSFELYKGKVCPCSLKHDASLAAAHQAAYAAHQAKIVSSETRI